MGTPVVTTKCRDTRLSEAQAASGFLLAGLLWCAGCRKQLQPLVLASGERSYDCRNGCRMHRLNATAVEGRAVDAARTSLLGVPRVCRWTHPGSPSGEPSSAS